jgi:hypothetical protein
MTLFLAGVALGSLLTNCALALCACAVSREDRADAPPPREIEPLPYTDMYRN